MKIVKAYGAEGATSTTITIPALSGNQMAILMYTITGGASGFTGNSKGYGGGLYVSGTGVSPTNNSYAFLGGGGSTYNSGGPSASSPVQFVTITTGSQNITATSFYLGDATNAVVSWNGILCIYNPPF